MLVVEYSAGTLIRLSDKSDDTILPVRPASPCGVIVSTILLLPSVNVPIDKVV